MPDDHCDLLCLDLPRAEELRRRRLPADVTEVMATKVRALADSTRLGLVAALFDGGELCVCDLAWISGKAQNLVSHHLRALKAAGLACSRREGKIVFYALTEEGERLFRQLAGEPALTALPETRR
jgi:ArsR family transcriptional regulator, lead/cadmium/zinc/bismuth-responsive transcriptional repressor